MLVVMKAQATDEQIRSVCQKIEELGYRAHAMPGAQRTAIGITGNRGEVEPGTLDEMPGVQELIRVSKPYKLVSRDVKAGKHGHNFSRHRRHIWRSRDCRHCRPLRHREPRAGHGGGRAGVPRRRAILPRRRLQASHLALFLPGTGRSGPADHGRSSRQVRHEDCHRGHRQRIAGTGGEVRRRDPDRRPQHAEFLACSSAPDGRGSRCC